MSEGKERGEAEVARREKESERGTWGNQCEFFMSCLGYAVGFGNVWRFPYLCYKNGGAAFLIPYVIMLFCAGLPLFFMELVLGQYASLGPAILFPKVAPIFTGLGWGMVLMTGFFCIYYNIILAWSLFYTFASCSGTLPWASCDNDFNSVECYSQDAAAACRNQSLFYYNKSCIAVDAYCGLRGLREYNSTHCFDPRNDAFAISEAEGSLPRISPSEDYFRNRMLGVTGRSWEDMGGMRWELVGCLALSSMVVAASLIKGIKSSGKVVYVTATFPYAVLLVLLIRGLTLEGAYTGIEFYFLKPDLSRLMEVEPWSDAAIQIFISVGVSFGSIMTLSSYNKFSNNCMRDAIVITLTNCTTSVFAGFVIFSILGFLATELGVEVKDVVSSGSGLAFVVYPAAVTRMPLPPLWSILFFVMLISLGLGTHFSMFEAVMTALFDRFESLRAKKPLIVVLSCGIMFLMGTTMCLEGGVFLLEVFDAYAAGLAVLVLSISQLVCVQYVYGFTNFMKLTGEMGIHISRPMRLYLAVTFMAITPVVLTLIFFFSAYDFAPASWGVYLLPPSAQILGWFISAASAGTVPVGAVFALWRNKSSFKSLFRVSADFCPAHERKRALQQSKQEADPPLPFSGTQTYHNEGFVGDGV
ncbi:sodium- and chloride-dependent glycine transporter 1-like [Penaeus japonicus]|uniref:sodium- and chloride-dependent glycine transporter 1-like n=1 Tax=Penaeus japonicus TaxID=27405 RepID=UPI001C70C0F5|nr:sodium- and chloride-dependent glycine transporter 1-like [Penaeus japonicus]